MSHLYGLFANHTETQAWLDMEDASQGYPDNETKTTTYSQFQTHPDSPANTTEIVNLDEKVMNMPTVTKTKDELTVLGWFPT
jgi:hypothetical protein